jgi:hypothetical protein
MTVNRKNNVVRRLATVRMFETCDGMMRSISTRIENEGMNRNPLAEGLSTHPDSTSFHSKSRFTPKCEAIIYTRRVEIRRKIKLRANEAAVEPSFKEQRLAFRQNHQTWFPNMVLLQ